MSEKICNLNKIGGGMTLKIPFTPNVGVNMTDNGWGGCYYEVRDRIVICHVAIKNAPTVGLTTALANIPADLVPTYRTTGVCGTGDAGTDVNILSQQPTDTSKLCVFGNTSGYITGNVMWTLD